MMAMCMRWSIKLAYSWALQHISLYWAKAAGGPIQDPGRRHRSPKSLIRALADTEKPSVQVTGEEETCDEYLLIYELDQARVINKT